MSDIVERLRDHSKGATGPATEDQIVLICIERNEAADGIEKLRAELKTRTMERDHALLHADSFKEETEDLLAENKKLKNDHADMLKRNAILRQREDLPVDRIPAHETMVKLQSELSELKKANEWQDIDSAPKDGTDIIVFDTFFLVSQASYSDSLGWCLHDTDGGVNENKDNFDLTHWHPLPYSPK